MHKVSFKSLKGTADAPRPPIVQVVKASAGKRHQGQECGRTNSDLFNRCSKGVRCRATMEQQQDGRKREVFHKA